MFSIGVFIMKLFSISDMHGSIKFIDPAAELISEADIVTISGDISSTGKVNDAEKVISQIEKYNSNIVAVHGNWDRIEVHDMLVERGYGIHSSGKIIDEIGFFGVGGSNPTPMKTASEYDEEEIYQFLEPGYAKVKNAKKIVLISHSPPYNTRDKTFLGLRGGSESVRDFLEKKPVNLCISGHIHEAFGMSNIGQCLIINPGSFKRGKYFIIEIDSSISANKGKIKKTR